MATFLKEGLNDYSDTLSFWILKTIDQVSENPIDRLIGQTLESPTAEPGVIYINCL